MRVMTFNIRRDMAIDPQSWSERKENVIRVIEDYQPKIIGFQEVMNTMFEDLKAELSNKYDYYGEFRSLDSDSEMVPIFIQKEVFSIVDSGSFMLAENPEERYAMGWDAVCPRITSWVALKNKDNQLFHVMNTHFDHMGVEARVQSSQLVLKRLSDLTNNFQSPAILMGDLNTLPTENMIDDLLEAESLQNSYAKLAQTTTTDLATFHDYEGTREGLPIDYIFISQNLPIKEAKIIYNQYDGFYPSDHYAVIVDL